MSLLLESDLFVQQFYLLDYDGVLLFLQEEHQVLVSVLLILEDQVVPLAAVLVLECLQGQKVGMRTLGTLRL